MAEPFSTRDASVLIEISQADLRSGLHDIVNRSAPTSCNRIGHPCASDVPERFGSPSPAVAPDYSGSCLGPGHGHRSAAYPYRSRPWRAARIIRRLVHSGRHSLAFA